MNIKFKEILGEAFPIIEKCAPLIASAIGGPGMGAAAQALVLLANAFETKNPLSVENIRDAILQHPNPEQPLQILNNDFPGLLKSHFPKEIDINADVKF